MIHGEFSVVHVIPWIHYAYLCLGTVAMVLAFALVFIAIQRPDFKEVPWLVLLALTFGISSFLALQSLDITRAQDMETSWKFRHAIIYVLYPLLCGFFHQFFRSWKRPVFLWSAPIFLIPLSMAIASGPFIDLVLKSQTEPWGEVISWNLVHPKLSVMLIQVITMVLFLIAAGRSLWMIFHKQERLTHAIMLFATLMPVAVTIISMKNASAYSLPRVPFVNVAFLLVMMFVILTEMGKVNKLSLTIAQRESQLRGMAEQVPGVLYSLLTLPNGARKFLYLSERSKDILGFAADHSDPMEAFAQGLSPEDFKRYQESEARAIQTLEPWAFTARFNRNDGSMIWFQGLSSVSRTSEGTQSNGVLFDITSRVAQEEERSALLAEVSMRKEELEAFLSSLSHDLRSPLVNIDGFAGELSRLLENPEYANLPLHQECASDLLLLKENTQRINELISHILALGRHSRDSLEIHKFDPTEIIDSLWASMDLPEGGVEIEIENSLPKCRADRKLMEPVLRAVLDNGVDYRKVDGQAKIRVSGTVKADRVVYAIKDNGIGFDPSYAENIFKAFHQLKPNKKHRGMGLTIARLALRRMGGNIFAESKAGVGTTFYIDLPAAS